MGRQFYNLFNNRNRTFLDFRARIALAAKQISAAVKTIKASDLSVVHKRILLTSIKTLETELSKEQSAKLLTLKYEALGNMLSTVTANNKTTREKLRELTNFIDCYKRPSTKSVKFAKWLLSIALLGAALALVVSAIYIMPVITLGVAALAAFSSITLALLTLKALFHKIIIPFSKLIQRFCSEYNQAMRLDARLERFLVYIPVIEVDDPPDPPDVQDPEDKEEDKTPEPPQPPLYVELMTEDYEQELAEEMKNLDAIIQKPLDDAAVESVITLMNNAENMEI